jgi:hypothetical protein
MPLFASLHHHFFVITNRSKHVHIFSVPVDILKQSTQSGKVAKTASQATLPQQQQYARYKFSMDRDARCPSCTNWCPCRIRVVSSDAHRYDAFRVARTSGTPWYRRWH